MSSLSTLVRRLRMLTRAAREDRGLDEEMRLHMDLRRDRLRADGVSEDEVGR